MPHPETRLSTQDSDDFRGMLAGADANHPDQVLRRMSGPRGWDVAQSVAEHEGVCIRPLALRQVDPDSGRSRVVAVACGATRDAVCAPCARKHRTLRAEQCRTGWHLADEPQIEREAPNADQRSLMGYRADLLRLGRQARDESDPVALDDVRDALGEVDEGLRETGVRGRLPGLDDTAVTRRVRSTRRRVDAPDLPRRPVAKQTVGRVFAGRYRPSMFVTLTLGSYGQVHSARRRGGRSQRCGCGRVHDEQAALLGAPVDPARYDYRQAARDAVHFSKLVDRFWQNLRRAVGWDVQYFGAVEAQRRLVPHLHTAIRGSIPRALLRQVIAGTYQHIWWPQHGDPLYGGDRLPVWVPEHGQFCDPDTRQPLPTFEDSLPGPDEQAAHVVRFGEQTDIRGLLGGSEETQRHVNYVTKYLTKSLGDTYTDASRAHREHADRLCDELAITPCSPRCAVWLLHGIQPGNARSTLTPGRCGGNAHKRHTLGACGRRVLVSRKWTGKRLADHKTDRAAFVQDSLRDAGITRDDDQANAFGNGTRTVWEPVAPGDPDVPPRPVLLLESVAHRRRWRAQYRQAQQVAALRDFGNPPSREAG